MGADDRAAPPAVTPPAAAALPHRPDIEGLRGVAVLSVFAVHSVPQAVGGGFIGVDVFLVLSGYLIASITLRELQAGTWSAAAFYARRMRRLLPALGVVLAACLLFAAVAAVPADARAIGRHVMAGAAFVSNLVLWREASYFDPISETKPLLHLWSLGIEAQFYAVWPLFAAVLARSRKRGTACIAAVALLSFLLNVGFVESRPKAVFFLPPTRLWEMLVGVGVALAAARGALAHNVRTANLLAGSGVLMLAAALALIGRTAHFPGAWALLPTGATAALLAAGPGSWIGRRLLAHPVLGFYGRISYPLYLWHWPLLTFALLWDGELGTVEHVALLALAVLLATLTHHAVELPLRSPRRGPGALRLQAGALAVMAACGATLVASDGWLARWPREVRTIARQHLQPDYAEYREHRCFQHSDQRAADFPPECADRGPPGAPLLLLWGDSHAASLYPGLRRWAGAGGGPRLAQYTGPLCPPLLQPSSRQRPGCEEVNRFVVDRVRELRPATVVLAAAWQHYLAAGDADAHELAGLVTTLRALKALEVPRVIVVGPLPAWRRELPRLLLAAWRDGDGQVPARLAHGLDTRVLQVEAVVAGIVRAEGAEFLSALEQLCNADGCETTVTEDGELHPMSFDISHLGSAGSARLVGGLAPALVGAARP